MGRIEQPELAEKEASLYLQAKGQRLRGQKCLFQLQARFSFAVDEEHHVRFPGKVRVYRSSQRQLQGLQRKAVLAWIVASSLEYLKGFGTFTRPASGNQDVGRDIDEPQRCSANLTCCQGGLPRWWRPRWFDLLHGALERCCWCLGWRWLGL